MSQRDWINRPATIIFAVTLLIIGLTYTGDKILEGWVRVHDANAAYQQNAEADRDKSADEIAENCQDPDVIFRECVRKNLESHYKDQATNEDLQAQQDMAFWAFWLLIASCAGIVISGFGVALLIRSISLGREANIKASDAVNAANDANNIMRAEQRPWVRILWQVSCEVEVRDDRVARICWRYNFENKGRTPAHNVRISWGVHRYNTKFVGAGGRPVPVETQKAISRKSVSQKVLFQGEKTEFIPSGHWTGSHTIEGDSEGDLFLCACVAYDLDPLGKSSGYETVVLGIRRDDDMFGPFAHRALNIRDYQEVR